MPGPTQGSTLTSVPVQEAIDRRFETLSRQKRPIYLFNGESSYRLCSIDDHRLISRKIQVRDKSQTDFYIVDLGGGDFKWGLEAVECINADDRITDVAVHIINVGAEQCSEEGIVPAGKCTLYKFGQFNIENLETEFRKRGLDLTNRVDLMVSRLCFPHLIDPVRSLSKAYRLLRPVRGIFLLDGFTYGFEGETQPVRNSTRMAILIYRLGARFLWQGNTGEQSLDHFVIQKPDEESLDLGMERHDYLSGMFGHSVIRFKREDQNFALCFKYPGQHDFTPAQSLCKIPNQQSTFGQDVYSPLPLTSPEGLKLYAGNDEKLYHELVEEDLLDPTQSAFVPVRIVNQ